MPSNKVTKPPKQSGGQGSRAQSSRPPQEVDKSTPLPTIKPSSKVTKPPKQSGSQGYRARSSRPPQEVDNSGEEFAFGEDDEESEDVEAESQILKTSTSKSAGVAVTDIGEFFTKNDKTQKRVCIPCGDIHGYDAKPGGVVNYIYELSTGNSNLRKHLIAQHKELYRKMSEKHNWKHLEKKSTVSVGANRKMALPPFSPQTFLEYLVRFVTADDQSIRVVECPEFRDLCMLLREGLADKDIPRRDKLRKTIMSQFDMEFAGLKTELSDSAGRVSLTCDIWSNQRMRSFLAVTVHWMANNNSKLVLRAGLIGFNVLKKKHTGVNIAKTLYYLIKRAGIQNKIGHITMDNAENNATTMKALQELLKEDEIDFDHKDKRIRCYPHIINICVQHIVASLKNVDIEEQEARRAKGKEVRRGKQKQVYEEDEGEDEDEDEDEDEAEAEADNDDDDDDDDGGYTAEGDVSDRIRSAQYDPTGKYRAYFENLKRDPVTRARAIVRTVRSSGQRREALLEVIKDGNKKQNFKDRHKNPIQIREVELIKDVKHRWDSLYLMISRLRELRSPLERYLKKERKLKPLLLSEGDWEVLDALCTVLEAPHCVQQVMSAHATPVLSGAIPSFELFMTKWETLGRFPELTPWTDIGLRWARKYYSRMDDTRAYVVAMFINPCIRFSWIEREWGDEYKVLAKEAILEVMKKCGQDQPPGQQPQAQALASPVKNVPKFVSLPSKFKLPDHLIYPQTQRSQSTDEDEFLKYTNGLLSPEDTDLVSFWEVSKSQYPRIFPVAMDYLPVQASSVPCEHVFSSAGETDTKKRNRLGTDLMEALQILKFIYKKERLNFSVAFQPDM